MNLKRVRRLYQLERLQLRNRCLRRKHGAQHRGPAPLPTAQAQRWIMDVAHDQLFDGQQFRVLTVVDQWNRESPVLESGCSLSGRDAVRALDQVIATRRRPMVITCNCGTAFTSRTFEAWAHQRGVQLDFTRPGNPTDNRNIESFNGRLRDECLKVQ